MARPAGLRAPLVGSRHAPAEHQRYLPCARRDARVGAAAHWLAFPDPPVDVQVLVEPLAPGGHPQAVDDEVVGTEPDTQAEGQAAAGDRVDPRGLLGQQDRRPHRPQRHRGEQ